MEVMDKWVAEFLLRRQHNPRVSSANLLSALKLGDSGNCLKLKMSSVLRDISNCVVRGMLDEGMLDLLEILENLQEHSVVMESHKSAYCWIAVECTLIFMWPLSASQGLLTDAFERIWKKRIGNLKEKGSDLVTDELLNWESDLKNALEDPEIYQRIRETNIRYTAITFLTQLLNEQWELLGCSSLETVVERRLLKRKARNLEDGFVDNRGDPNDDVDVSRRCLESDTVDKANEPGGTGEREEGNGNDRKNGNDVAGAARELKDYLLEIQGHIDPSTRQGQEPNVTPQPSRDNRTGGSSQYHNEARQQNNANEKGSDSQGTWSGRVRPRLSTPIPLNVTPLKTVYSNVKRPKKFWTPEEVEALREGVKEYGKSWKDIKNANPAVFKERTEVDLKDKWRNLIR